jgi:hypothetical protein
VTIYNDSYDTTVGSMYTTASLEHHIKDSLVRNGNRYTSMLVRDVGDVQVHFVTGRYTDDQSIPIFSHPMLMTIDKVKVLVTDIRLCVNKAKVSDFEWGYLDKRKITEIASNLSEFTFARNRAILNLLWVGIGPSSLRSGTMFASTVYSYWVSEMITKMFALDGGDSMTVTIVASYYYQTLFVDSDNLDTSDEDTKVRMMSHTIKTTKLPASEVSAVYDRLTGQGSVTMLCDLIKVAVNNVRLEGLDSGGLMTLARNSWYGINAKEIISVALEHPPTWMTIVHAALINKSYKSSTIFRVAERWGKRGLSDEYIKTINTIVDEDVGYQPHTSPSNESIGNIVVKDF